jgi:aminoglycoside 3'-phosphotransferase I
MDREHSCLRPELPAELYDPLQGYSWSRNLIGESGGEVYRLHGKLGAPELYAKHGCGSIADTIVDEMVRLHWLASYFRSLRLCISPVSEMRLGW